MLRWCVDHDELPMLVLLRRYLKLAIRHCVRHNLMDIPLADASALDPPLPFSLDLVPHQLPEPALLVARLLPND